MDGQDHQHGRWVETDEAEDVAGSVRHVLRCWPLTVDDPQAFKWTALALHAALQGACVCHLTTTCPPVGAVTERNAGEWLAWYERSRTDPDAKAPKTYLMDLPALLKTIRQPDTQGGGETSAGISLTDGELNWLLRFHNDLRNQFVHFSPQGWSIEISGLPGLAELTARIITAVLDTGWGFRHKDTAWCDALRADLEGLSRMS
ncbi:hypothetical protein CA606_00780 [Caulobacter vibrioides]|uniref:Apea-like HEPN domain-containing protein n=1 Tax=Caulobacter vibrioides TaxID=155892 RepID=A0A290MME9_CAUVI|nr:hypothetical protein [Caulobacter vibrioides]ATC30997.1 hypothetical protein CA606_00780 [Caulobacter vibrioides]